MTSQVGELGAESYLILSCSNLQKVDLNKFHVPLEFPEENGFLQLCQVLF